MYVYIYIHIYAPKRTKSSQRGERRTDAPAPLKICPSNQLDTMVYGIKTAGRREGSNIAQWHCSSIATVWAKQVKGGNTRMIAPPPPPPRSFQHSNSTAPFPAPLPSPPTPPTPTARLSKVLCRYQVSAIGKFALLMCMRAFFFTKSFVGLSMGNSRVESIRSTWVNPGASHRVNPKVPLRVNPLIDSPLALYKIFVYFEAFVQKSNLVSANTHLVWTPHSLLVMAMSC